MQNHHILTALGMGARHISSVINAWPVFLIAALLISPVGPHLRYSYVWNGSSYYQCTYLGSRGFIEPEFTPDCPLLVITDARKWKGGRS